MADITASNNKVILDLNIYAGYPYDIRVDFDDSDGADLEGNYACYFECDSIGQLQFSLNATNDAWELEITKENTVKLLTNLEEYVVYTIKTVGGSYAKLMSGRIHVDTKVRT